MYGLNHNIFAHKVDDIKIIANIDSQIRKNYNFTFKCN